jgi:hypothetical protein
MSVAATAGAAAWMVPEILTAKPAAGASVSVHGTTGGSGSGGTPPSSPTSTPGSNPTTSPASTGPGTLAASSSPAASPASTLAFTGIDIQRDAEIGAALVAGGWAMHHWSSRTPKPATEAAADGVHQAGSQVDPS